MAAARSILAGAAAALALAAALTLPQSPAHRDARVVAQRDVLDPWYQALAESDQAPATVVVLGDSVSEGFGVRDHLDRRWVGQLQDALREQAKAPGCPVGPIGPKRLSRVWRFQPPSPDPLAAMAVERRPSGARPRMPMPQGLARRTSARPSPLKSVCVVMTERRRDPGP